MAEEERKELGQSPAVEATPAGAGQAADGQAAGAPAAAMTGQESVAPIAAASQPQKVDLTQFEEFRRWQSERDRREAELRRQADETQKRLLELERQAQQVEAQRLLQDASPEEIATYYQGLIARLQAEQEQQAARAAQQREIQERGARLLEELGLSPDTPGLDWGDGSGPSPENYARLAESAARLVALAGGQAAKAARERAERAAREARQQAIAETGATQVSTATGPAPQSLREEYEKQKAALRGSGDFGALARLKAEYRRKGLDV